MKIMQWWTNVSRYFWEAATRIFGPSDDDYPETGVQPFEGDLSEKSGREL